MNNKVTLVIATLVIVLLIGLNSFKSNSKNSQDVVKNEETIQKLKNENNELNETVNSLEKKISEGKINTENQIEETENNENKNLIEQLIHAYYDKSKDENRSEQLQIVQKITSDKVYNYLNNNKGETNFESDNLVSKVNSVSIFFNQSSDFLVRYELTFQDGILEPVTFTLIAEGKIVDNKITDYEVIYNNKKV